MLGLAPSEPGSRRSPGTSVRAWARRQQTDMAHGRPPRPRIATLWLKTPELPLVQGLGAVGSSCPRGAPEAIRVEYRHHTFKILNTGPLQRHPSRTPSSAKPQPIGLRSPPQTTWPIPPGAPSPPIAPRALLLSNSCEPFDSFRSLRGPALMQASQSAFPLPSHGFSRTPTHAVVRAAGERAHSPRFAHSGPRPSCRRANRRSPRQAMASRGLLLTQSCERRESER